MTTTTDKPPVVAILSAARLLPIDDVASARVSRGVEAYHAAQPRRKVK